MPKLHINDNGVWKVVAGDPLMASPNILINNDVLHPINQRQFNGNWGNLSVGDYGYDRWLKADATHKGQIVAAGNFVPNTTYTLGYNVGATRTFVQLTSRASGHWLIKVPFNADQFDLYQGTEERPWNPEGDSKKSHCQAYYEIRQFAVVSYASSAVAVQRTYISFTNSKRTSPQITLNKSSGPATNAVAVYRDSAGLVVGISSTGASQAWSGNYRADAELTLGDL